MDETKLKNRLEIATNIAVLFVAVAVLSVFAWSYFSRPRMPKLNSGLQRGVALSQIANLDYNSSPRTLLVAMSTRCHSCKESTPFYNRLVDRLREDSATRLVAIFPEHSEEVAKYAEQNQLKMTAIPAVDFRSLNLTSIPTILLVDNEGKVSDFWIGKLPEAGEQQVAKVASLPKD